MIAQVLKVLINFIKYRKFNWKVVWSSGGMPSSHSATVTSLAISLGLTQGFSSPLFAIAAIFAFITMYDAAGVRRETGDIAKIINDLVLHNPEIENSEEYKDLKELVGHSPLEVLGGALLGTVMPFIVGMFIS
ncbi:MAG: divergent PAP2 family protein [Clostridia bacterium]|nr:divergent PAP2 family protein [Clostridia bacterium]